MDQFGVNVKFCELHLVVIDQTLSVQDLPKKLPKRTNFLTESTSLGSFSSMQI
jgi:hypothetical protein